MAKASEAVRVYKEKRLGTRPSHTGRISNHFLYTAIRLHTYICTQFCTRKVFTIARLELLACKSRQICHQAETRRTNAKRSLAVRRLEGLLQQQVYCCETCRTQNDEPTTPITHPTRSAWQQIH